jgi:hypothetical protein
MEIEAKENVVSSWNLRIREMKQNRQLLIGKKMRERQDNIAQIDLMAKREQRILEEIYRADDTKKQVNQVIQN